MRAPPTTSLAAVAGLAMLVATASGVAAQHPMPPYPYPANDTPLGLPSGAVASAYRSASAWRGDVAIAPR